MSVISDKFFADKAVGALWDVAVSIKRGNPLPLDKDAVVHGIDELNAVAAGAVSYPGQIIAVVIDAVKDGDEVVSPERVDLYYLDHEKTPRLVAPEVEIPEVPEYVGDDKSITVTNHAISLLGFASAEDGKLPMKENGAIVWKSLEDIGAGDGNDNTTYTFEALTDKAGFKVQALFNGQPQGEAVEIALANVYTKGEVDNLLGGKVDSATLNNYYTKTEVDNLLKDYAKTADVNKTLEDYAKSADVYTKTEADGLLGAKANAADVYTKTEVDGLVNGVDGKLAGYYTKSEVEGLVNGVDGKFDGYYTKDEVDGLVDGVEAIFGDYYKKTETMSTEEINTAISTAVGNADHLKREIVTALPDVSAADEHTIYMIKDSSLTSGDVYKEYMLINGAFEQIGDSTVDLTDYYTKEQTNAEIKKVDDKFAGYNTKEEVAAAIKVETDRAVAAEGGLSGRLDTAEDAIEQLQTDLDLAEEGLALKASQADLEALQTTVGNNKTAIEGTVATLTETVATNKKAAEDAIALKADLSAHNELAGTVAGHTTAIGEINTALEGKASTQSVTELTTTVNGKADKATTLAGYGITDAYTAAQTDAAILAKIGEMTGGESAADVLALLNAYKAANDREVWGDEFVNGHTTDGKYEPDYSGKSLIDILLEDVATKAAAADVVELGKTVTANGTAITNLQTAMNAKADQTTVEAIQNTINGLDNTYAKDSELTAAVESLTELINGKVAQGDFDGLAGIVGGHTTSLENHAGRIKTIEDALPGLATTESVNTLLADYAKTAEVAATYLTKTDAGTTYATKAEITEANYVSYSDTVIMNGGSASLN